MKKMLCLLVALLAVLGASAWAEDGGDSEDALRSALTAAAGVGGDRIAQFDYADYDGDGAFEAFAILSEHGWSESGDGISGEIWFVSPRRCAMVHGQDSFLDVGRIGVGPCLYTAEIWYGGSGSTSAVWGVSEDREVALPGDSFEGIQGGNIPNEFYMYPSEFDQSTDGTGHTWKRYYYFLDGLTLCEYGGLSITREQLEQAGGAADILARAEAEGWTVGEIFYRENGVVNVNLTDGTVNDNLTLRYDGQSVTDTGDRFGGVYRAASGRVGAVTYPRGFEFDGAAFAPIVDEGGDSAAEEEAAGPSIDPGVRDGIVASRGVFDTDDLFNVTGARFSTSDQSQLARIYFKEDVFRGGSEGYMGNQWLSAGGALSEALADLDGDGEDEYLLLCLDSRRVDTEYGPNWENDWSLAVYEPAGEGYALSCEFPIDVSWWDQRSVGLAKLNGRTRILCTGGGRWDGGGGGQYGMVYSYDGQSVTMDAFLYATVGENSYLMVGRFDPAIMRELWSDIYQGEQALMDKYGLVKGENYWSHVRPDSEDWDAWYGETVVYIDDDGSGSTLNRRAFAGFDEIAARAEDYGLHTFYNVSLRQEHGWTNEYFEMYIERGDTLLLWASEGIEGEESHIDIVTHFIDTPIIDAKGNEGGIPLPQAVIPEIPKPTGGFDAPDIRGAEDGGEADDDGAEEDGERCVRTTGDVNLRSRPDKTSSVVCAIPAGTTLEYLGETSTDSRGIDWYRVRYRGSEGWTSSMYSTLQGGSRPADTPPASRASDAGSARTTGNANLRDRPSLNGGVIATIPGGTTVEFLGETSTDDRGVNWYKVRYKGHEGWASSKYTQLR